MNCQDAESQILAARDAPLGAADAAVLAQHLQECASCRRLADGLTHAAEAWREKDQAIAIPDARREWHAVRRRIRQTSASPTPAQGLPSWNRLLRLALPVAGAAAVAIGISIRQAAPPEPSLEPILASADWSHLEEHFTNYARAEYVETDNIDVSPFVYVDEESGWLIVWASDDPTAPSS